jgi:UPF0755 protein
MLRVLRAVLVVVLLLAMAGAALLWWEYRRFTGTAFGSGLGGERDIEVPAGATLAHVARSLESAGVVSDGARFFLFARLQHAERKLKRGEYAFTGPLTPAQVLDMLVQGKVKTYRVTVPEGLRVDEIAPLFARAGVADEARFLAAAHDRSLLHRLGIEGPSAEGFLFPDTYVEPKGRTETAILEEMVEHFRAAYAQAQAQADPAVHLNELQAATLASIIEKETGAPEERPHISCVFHNRLRIGMRLMTDPTVIYAHILATGSFDGNITKAMLLEPHPYNTYTVAGLPPGPIANAGAASLNAALHPSVCDDLYFVARGDGHSVFCRDYACHNANVERYQVAPFRRAQK